MHIDVALVPSEVAHWPAKVCIVVDELRASSTLTTLLDIGAPEVLLTRGLAEARRLARERGSLLAGERHGLPPAGFDFDNSPSQLARAGLGGRSVILSTSNGTAMLSRLQAMPAVLVGCLLNAGACAAAALELASSLGVDVGIVCAGRLRRFTIDDAVAAGELVDRLVAGLEARGEPVDLTDAALAARRLRSAYPDVELALAESASGRLITSLGAGEDVAFCAQIDATTTVPFLRAGSPLRVEPWGSAFRAG